MSSPHRETQRLWLLSQTVPWLGDLEDVAAHELRQSIMGAEQRQFETVADRVSWLERSLGLPEIPARRMPSSAAVQRRVLDALGVNPHAYDFYAGYSVSGVDVYVFTHDDSVAGSCRAGLRIDAALRRHYHRTGRVALRSSPEAGLAGVVSRGICPSLDLAGLDPVSARIYLAVSSIEPGQVRGIDWVIRSIQCPGVDCRTVMTSLNDNPFPYIVPTFRVFGADGWPVLGGLAPVEVEMLANRENRGLLIDTLARGARYVARPVSGEYCELGCAKARIGERGAFLIRDVEELCEELVPCPECGPIGRRVMWGTTRTVRSRSVRPEQVRPRRVVS